MLRDITIGQHFPGNSLVHRFDPRLKLVLTIAYIVLLFAASNPLGLTLSILFLAVMYRVAKIPGKMILKSLKPILPIVVFTAVLNLFFVSGEGEPLVHIGFLTIYAEGVRYAVLMAVRVMALIAGTSLLTYTTSPIVLTDAIEQLLKPLGKLHFPVHELAMLMSIALRFIPTLIEETDKIMNAQKARGAQLDTGKMTDRVKALVPVLIPLFISAFRRADELAMAMECRCYRGGDGRTRLKVLRCEKQDYIDLAVCIACFAVILGVPCRTFYLPLPTTARTTAAFRCSPTGAAWPLRFRTRWKRCWAPGPTSRAAAAPMRECRRWASGSTSTPIPVSRQQSCRWR